VIIKVRTLTASVDIHAKRALLATLVAIFCVAVFFSGCGGPARDVSTPHAALLGQWKPLSTGPAYIFFSPDTATYLPKEGGESIALQYEVVEENGDESWIKIRYIDPGDPGDEAEPFTIEFSEDWNRFYLYPAGSPERLHYAYVDDRQSP
jgi:hypothetical protein